MTAMFHKEEGGREFTPHTKPETVIGPTVKVEGTFESQDNILKAYMTGRGSFRLRAKWEVEKLEFGQYQIVVTEIPYLVQKSKLVEKIAETDDVLLEKYLANQEISVLELKSALRRASPMNLPSRTSDRCRGLGRIMKNVRRSTSV